MKGERRRGSRSPVPRRSSEEARVTHADASPARSAEPGSASREDRSRAALLAKYEELCGKYHDLVRRYESQVLERSGAVSLALTAMRTSTTGLALFAGDSVIAQNPPFDELSRVRGEWRRLGGPQPARRGALRDVARAEAKALLDGEERAQAVARYQHEASGRIVDVHVERGGREHTVAVIVHDVTDRCRAEHDLEQAKQAVFEQQRMRAVGELASGVAHDLNNALHAMSMRLEALRRAAVAHPEVDRHVGILAQIVGDLAIRVGRLQEFARQRQDTPHESVDLAAVIQDAVALGRTEVESTSQRHGRHIVIETSLEDALPRVSGVAAELRHVFMNLLLNARDAMTGGGAIQIAARTENGHVVVTVVDDGPGISPAHLSRVFEPFFTTKAEKGTGLGLAIAYGVMRRLGGGISAANRDGGGAVFILTFPVATAPEKKVPAAAPKAAAIARGRRVLVIDDDTDNLEAMRFVLEDLGQEVATARSGTEAVAMFRAGDRYDLVLCDLGMPGMNGWQTAREIRTVAPGTRIQMLTGWAQEIAPDDPLRSYVEGVQPKPLPVEQLQRLLAFTT